MTAFAIHCGQTTATIAADSLVYLPSRSNTRHMGFASKVQALPHMRAAIFARGQHLIPVSAFGQLTMLPHIRAAEEAAEVLANVLRGTTDVYAADHDLDRSESASVADTVMIGWHTQRRRMLCWQFRSWNDYEPEEVASLTGFIPFPTIPQEFMPRFIKEDGREKHLVRIIEAIGQIFADNPKFASGVGGEVIATEITPTGVTQKILGRLASYDRDLDLVATEGAQAWSSDVDTLYSEVIDAIRQKDELTDFQHLKPPEEPAR